MSIARVEGGEVLEYPLTVGDLKRAMPLTGWPGKPTSATLQGTPYVIVEPTDAPAVDYGEVLLEVAPTYDADTDTWNQQWTKTRVTLVEAKQSLARLAIDIYWSKMLTEPSVQEMQAATGSFIAVIQARETRFNPKLQDVAGRIQAAASIDDAYAIYQELEAFV